MSRRTAALVLFTLFLPLGAFVVGSSTRAAARPVAASPAAALDEARFAQVRAEYVDLSGNRDETSTTCLIVNKSASQTIVLGDISALGPNGAAEVISIDTQLNGVTIPPLASLELPVDAAHFPGLAPKVETNSRGVESVVVSWSGPKEALRLTALVRLQQPGSLDNRTVNYVDGHYLTK